MKRFLASFLFMACLWAGGVVEAATYYVDCNAADDNGAGTSAATAWKTISKVNSSTFAAGDFVYFNRGCTWSGTKWTPGQSGTSSAWITFGAYGSGAKPVIQGPGSDFALVLSGRSYLIFQDLQLENNNNIVVRAATNSGSFFSLRFYRNVIKVTGGTAASKHNVYFLSQSIDVYDIVFEDNEFQSSNTGSSSNLLMLQSSTNVFYDITIRHNNFHDSSNAGIVFLGDSVLTPSNNASAYGVDVDGNTFTNLGSTALRTGAGIKVVAGGHPSYIRNNVLTTIGNASTGKVNGIQGSWLRGVIIENNTVTGVFTNDPDGSGIAIDRFLTDSNYPSDDVIVRYNTISGCNAGALSAGIAIYTGTDTIVHHNVVFNSSTGIIQRLTQSTGNVYYNNTLSGNDYGGVLGTNAVASTWKNNILSSSSIAGFYTVAGATQPTETYNLLWNNTEDVLVDVTPGTPHATDVLGNPSFLVGSYQPLWGSPARDAGTGVGLEWDRNGYRIDSLPDIGAYEYQPPHTLMIGNNRRHLR